MVQNWGMEVNLAALLLAAFFALNALSLVYMAIVALGMGLPADKRRAFWRWAMVPILGLLLLSQYSILLGLPPLDLSTGEITASTHYCLPSSYRHIFLPYTIQHQSTGHCPLCKVASEVQKIGACGHQVKSGDHDPSPCAPHSS